jgi:hypothetical protein
MSFSLTADSNGFGANATTNMQPYTFYCLNNEMQKAIEKGDTNKIQEICEIFKKFSKDTQSLFVNEGAYSSAFSPFVQQGDFEKILNTFKVIEENKFMQTLETRIYKTLALYKTHGKEECLRYSEHPNEEVIKLIWDKFNSTTGQENACFQELLRLMAYEFLSPQSP